MVFSSNEFLFVFFPLVLLAYYFPCIKSRRYRNTVLLIASIFFYAWGEPVFVFIMLLVALINWFAGVKMDGSQHKRSWALFAIILDVVILTIFKYLTFISHNIAGITKNEYIVFDIALPIGISFFSFQMISYVLDVLWGRAKAQKNPLDVLLYITMFPQLIAGPIVRYVSVENEINNRKENRKSFTDGVIRFVYGLGKKMLLANYLATIVDYAFRTSMGGYNISQATAWLGAISYTLQIYFDFSGYSDMAIGLGLIFGFHFPENFKHPYMARTVNEFWRRWHISLSSWFRDYIYIPLGGNRVSRVMWIRNMFIVWLLTGIWHGANWTFIIWGLLYFIILTLEKMIGVDKIEKFSVFSRLYTLLVVIVAWVIFRADTVTSAIGYLKNMVGINTVGITDEIFFRLLTNCKFFMIFSLVLSFPIYQKAKDKIPQRIFSFLEAMAALTIFVLSIASCIQSSYNPFIYFNF